MGMQCVVESSASATISDCDTAFVKREQDLERVAPLRTQDVLHDSSAPLTLMDEVNGAGSEAAKTILLERDDASVTEVLLANKIAGDQNLVISEGVSHRPSTTASKAHNRQRSKANNNNNLDTSNYQRKEKKTTSTGDLSSTPNNQNNQDIKREVRAKSSFPGNRNM